MSQESLIQEPKYPHEPILPQYVDSTMLVTAKACLYKYYQEYVCRRSPSARSPDLHAGGAVAEFFETFRKSYYGEKLSKKDSIEKAARAFLYFWGDYEPHDKKGQPHVKSIANTFGACLDYLSAYPPETDIIQPYYKEDGEPTVEFTFAHPLPIMHPVTGEPILYCGRYDLLGEMGGIGWVEDEKTTKSFFQNWSEQWHLRTQFLGYTWATRELGWKVQGAVVRGIAIQKSQYKHQQAIIPFTDEKVWRWHKQMLRDVQRIVDAWNEGYWDQDFGEACSAWGGCQFHDVCSSDNPDVWYADFHERLWNPLAKDPTDPRLKEAA